MIKFQGVKEILVLVLLTFFVTVNVSAKTFDGTGLSAEEIVNKLLDSSEPEPPTGFNINCDLNTNFIFINSPSFHEEIPKNTKRGICKEINEYNDFYQKLYMFWPIEERFGLQILIAPSIESLNGAYHQRPILNKKNSPYFSLFYYDNIVYDLNYSIWSHEYGHAVFGNMIDNFYFPLERAAFIRQFTIQLQQNDWSSQRSLLYDERDRLSDIRDQLYNGKNKSDLSLASQQLSKTEVLIAIKENELSEKSKSYYKYLSFLASPYHEFFADIFAGFFHSNINVVGDNFAKLGGGFALKSESRRFLPHNTKKAIANKWADYETHHFFTPARHYLGTLKLSNIRSQKMERQFLELLSQFILNDIKWLIEEAQDSEYISYQPLIKKIKKANDLKAVELVFNDLDKTRQIDASFYFDDLFNYCAMDFPSCKRLILDQLSLGRRGMFLLSPDIVKSNERLILAIEKIYSKVQMSNP